MWSWGSGTLIESSPLFFFFFFSSGHLTVPDKVQELADSLQQISGQFNSVLSALGSLMERQSSVPLAQPHAAAPPVLTLGHTSFSTPPPLTLPEPPPWSWTPQSGSAATPHFSTPLASGLRSSDDINSRWSQIFPGTLYSEGAFPQISR